MLSYRIFISEYQLKILQVEFTGQETIEIDLTDFYKDQSYLDNLYTHINEYVALLPIEVQQKIYDIFYYTHNREYRKSYSDPEAVVALELKVAEVSKLLNYNQFLAWMKTRQSEMIVPETIKDFYTHDPDMNTTEEKTYIRSEYCDLISLIVFIRALSPLYVDFYNYVKQVTSRHCYYKLFMLLIQSDIYTCREIEKLKTYIEVNQQTLIGATKNEHRIIALGLSDDDVLDSLISEIIFNKLLTIDFFNKKCNIVSFVFQTIKYKGSFATGGDSDVIRSKTVSANSGSEDMSYFEDYRKTSSVPLGTVVEIQHALSNTDNLITTLGLTNFNYELYAEELKNVKFLMEKTIDKIQIYMLGWFLNKIINPRALHYISRRKVIELMLFAKVVLLDNDQKFIAMFLSSYKSNNCDFINVVIRNTLNKSLLRRLNEYFGLVVDDDRQSVVEKTITELSKEIVNSLWIPLGTESQLKGIANSNGYLDMPNNINDLVTNYVEFVVR